MTTLCPECLQGHPADVFPDGKRLHIHSGSAIDCLDTGVTLWLDDIREPWAYGYTGAEWVRTADEAIALLKTGRVEFASLDHDLSVEATMGTPAPGERTGYTVICWLEEHPEYWPPRGVAVHSLNPVGKIAMQGVIRAHYGRNFTAASR